MRHEGGATCLTLKSSPPQQNSRRHAASGRNSSLPDGAAELTVNVSDALDQRRIRVAVTELHEHISKEEDGPFPASLTALSARDWDEAMSAWRDAHPGVDMMSD